MNILYQNLPIQKLLELNIHAIFLHVIFWFMTNKLQGNQIYAYINTYNICV